MKVGKTELFNYFNSFLQAQCVCSLLHCFPGRLQQDSDTSYALSHPDLSLAPFRLSFSLLRASERLSTDSFNSLPRSRTLIIPFTPSGPPRKHSTQRSLTRRTREGALCCPSDACSGYEHAQSLPSTEHCIKSSVSHGATMSCTFTVFTYSFTLSFICPQTDQTRSCHEQTRLQKA